MEKIRREKDIREFPAMNDPSTRADMMDAWTAIFEIQKCFEEFRESLFELNQMQGELYDLYKKHETSLLGIEMILEERK